VGGATAATAAASIATILAPWDASAEALIVLCNWGANEMTGALPAEATWEANYLTIIDAVLAKWPNATVYLMYPWIQGQDAKAATLHGYIDTIIAARPGGRVVAGPDEAVWLKGADDGATMTTDGIHYSAAGMLEAAAQWATVLGW